MCELCMTNPCDSRCPNAPEPEAVFKCSKCKEDIEEGELYYEFDGEHYHEDCFRDCAVDLLLENGASSGIAEVEENADDDY